MIVFQTANTFINVRNVTVTAIGLMTAWMILSLSGSSGASGFGQAMIGSKSKFVKLLSTCLFQSCNFCEYSERSVSISMMLLLIFQNSGSLTAAICMIFQLAPKCLSRAVTHIFANLPCTRLFLILLSSFRQSSKECSLNRKYSILSSQFLSKYCVQRLNFLLRSFILQYCRYLRMGLRKRQKGLMSSLLVAVATSESYQHIVNNADRASDISEFWDENSSPG